MNEPLRLKETKTRLVGDTLSFSYHDEWTSPIKGDENQPAGPSPYLIVLDEWTSPIKGDENWCAFALRVAISTWWMNLSD